MARRLLVEAVLDTAAYARGTAKTVGLNRSLASSFTSTDRTIAVSAEKSAAIRAAAAVKEQEALRASVRASRRFALTAPTPQLKEAAFAQAAAGQEKLDRALGNVQRTASASARSQAIYGRSLAGSSRASETFTGRVKDVERELSRTTRGALAGSGVFRGLGRSIAFASGAFLGISAISSTFRDAVDGAETLQKATNSLSVVIRRTGGNVDQIIPRIEAWAKTQIEFGVSTAQAEQGLARVAAITGSVQAGMIAYSNALVIARATGKNFNSVLIAAAKAQVGQTTALARYIGTIPKGTTAQELHNRVMERFGGQARANTTATDQLRASFESVTAAIGTALLPTVEKYAESLARFFSNAQNQKRITDDAVKGFNALASILGGLVTVVRAVDKVTGGFANTLKIIIGFKIARAVSGFIISLDALAGAWGRVAGAATLAGRAETAALGAGGLRGGAAAAATAKSVGSKAVTAEEGAAAAGLGAGFVAAFKRLTGRGQPSDVVKRVNTALNGTAIAATAAEAKVTGLRSALTSLSGLTIAAIGIPIALNVEERLRSSIGPHLGGGQGGAIARDLLLPHSLKDFTGVSLFNDIFNFRSKASKLAEQIADEVQKQITANLSRGDFAFRLLPSIRGVSRTGGVQQQGPFGSARPQRIFTQQFTLRPAEELAQARAGLTRSQQDDTKAARELVARIKRLIDEGRLKGAALRQALQAEAGALSTIWSAEDAAAQARAQRVEAMIDPIRLEVQLSREQATGGSTTGTLRALRAAAQKALRSGKLTLEQQKEAWDRIAELNGEIKDSLTAATVTFQVPPELQLSLARDQALGRDLRRDLLKIRAAILRFIRTHRHNVQALIDAYGQLADINQQLGRSVQSFTLPPRLQLALARDAALGLSPTKDLLRARAAILRFIKTHKNNIAALTDAYNQLADINQQLSSTAQAALGNFKQLNTRQIANKVKGLTEAQRAQLRAVLSQEGPGGTFPGGGVGAAGFIIDPETGRPRRRRPRRPRTGTASSGGGVDGNKPIVVKADFDFDIFIGGKHVEAEVTQRQQKRRRRNPTSRRGPNAGTATA